MAFTARRAIGVFAVVAISILVAAPKLRQLWPDTKPDGPAAAATILQVTVHEVQPERLAEVLATTGTIRANEEVELVSEVSGKVTAIHFDEGSRVAAGDLLVKIDDSELVAQRERTLHRVGLAKRAEERQERLLNDGVISSENYDVALGELNVLRAELQLIEAQLLKTEIRASFGGVIGLRWVSPGSFLSPQTRIATLRDLDQVKVDFTVPEKYANLMREGNEIAFRIDGTASSFAGSIFAIEPSVDQATRSLRVRARCANSDGVLLPGAFANVELEVRAVDEALTVPSIAVIPELGGKKVFVFSDGKAEPRSVETGIRTDEMVQITDGLINGDLVIVSAIQQLRAGREVVLNKPQTELEPTS
ncbi:MAG: efflux RND transporter periplasmic adaptor subunit [bacterium]|nr:efflux RND transporter periplasmic adaptor subunit [bacterium]